MAGAAALTASYSGVRVLVTGASGFIGRWIARYLTRDGAELVLAVRDASAMRDVATRYAIRGEVRVVDFRDARAIEVLIRETRPAVTFNAVGYGVDRAERDEELLEELNVDAVQHIGRSVARHGSPWPGLSLVHTGSALEYGEVGGDLREEVEALPSTSYGRAKLRGTLALAGLAQETGLRAITARLFTVYGPGEHPGRLLPSILEGRVRRNSISRLHLCRRHRGRPAPAGARERSPRMDRQSGDRASDVGTSLCGDRRRGARHAP
jgi:nucleoside-diphosphate-sugar epimerase